MHYIEDCRILDKQIHYRSDFQARQSITPQNIFSLVLEKKSTMLCSGSLYFILLNFFLQSFVTYIQNLCPTVSKSLSAFLMTDHYLKLFLMRKKTFWVPSSNSFDVQQHLVTKAI